MIGLTAPGAAGRGFTPKSPAPSSPAEGVSGKVPGTSSFFFSSGTAAAKAAVVESGVTVFMMAAVAGASLTIRSGVRILFSLPLSSISFGAV